MNTIQNIINQSLFNTIIDFIKDTKYCVVTHNEEYLLIEFKNRQNWSSIINEKQLHVINDKTPLYYTQNDLDNNKKGIVVINIQENLQSIFFNKWLSLLDKEFYPELFSISGKILSFSNRLIALKNNINLFKEQFCSKKKNIVKIPDNKELQHILNILGDTISDNNIKKQLLLQYCQNHSVLFNRIESQSILNNFIEKHLSRDNLPDIKLEFKSFLKDQNENKSYFETVFPVHLYRINKKRLFSSLYHPNLTDKYQLVTFMENLHDFIINKDTLEQCSLSNVYLNDTDGVHDCFTWVFHTNSVNSNLNYQELLEQLINRGSEHITSSITDFSNIFKTILNHYLLSKKIQNKDKENSGIVQKVNKI